MRKNKMISAQTFTYQTFKSTMWCISILSVITFTPGIAPSNVLQSALAASEKSTTALTTQLPVNKATSLKALEKYPAISITLEESGKEVIYKGVPLRAFLAEMVPEFKIDVMPEWKALTRQELVMEVMGDDGYAALVTATDLAINKSGDRFLLATEKDGKAIESGVHLICKMDEARVRWIRGVVSLRLLSVAKKP